VIKDHRPIHDHELGLWVDSLVIFLAEFVTQIAHQPWPKTKGNLIFWMRVNGLADGA
jgi:hypothetical protein